MAELNLPTTSQGDSWATVAPDLSLTQLDNLERDGVNIQCYNSSDFVIGRQTNFNGPVTIITCAEVLKQRHHGEGEETTEDDVVIREKVLSQSAAIGVQKLAMEKPETGDQTPEAPSKFEKLKKPSCIFALICTSLLIVASIALVVLPTAPTEQLPKCTPLSNNACIYSEFIWGGRPISNGTKPLEKPISHVIISQTYEEFCFSTPTCLNLVEWHQLNRTNETICNFFMGGDGNAYEDFGWSYEIWPQALQICIMGTYTEEEYPTYPQMVATKSLIQFGVDMEYISDNYTLVPSNAVSPDRHLGSIYQIINKWPKFSEDPF